MTLRSMTGFGSAQVDSARLRASVVARSVNHRFLDLSVHLSRRLAELEPEVRRMVQARVHRGKVEVSVQARWQAGCDNGMQLWRDISTQGYRGSRALVAGWVARQRGVLPAAPDGAGLPKRRGRRPREHAPAPAPRSLSARRAAWLLIHQPADLEPDEQEILAQLTATCSAAAVAYGLAQAFTQMVRERNAAALDGWFAAVEESGLADLRSFAAGLRRDEAAVRAGLS